MTKQTFQIRIRGQVQGVGFRPFIYRLAVSMGFTGRVLNDGHGVLVMVNGHEDRILDFIQQINDLKPPLALITFIEYGVVPDIDFITFSIIESELTSSPDNFLTPDAGICPDCRDEMKDTSNRRFGYAFITCTNCGPRYSITEALPFDRERTSMRGFMMCATCRAEYEQPADRRYFSQTNSCADCGIKLQLDYPNGQIGEHPLTELAEVLNSGGIAAVMGIGGYLLLCDARNESAIHTLRRRKQRPTKPFALMYASVEQLRTDVVVSEEEERALLGAVAPVVLLEKGADNRTGIAAALIAPGLNAIGAMLPYAPLLQWIADSVPFPLVATSGNLSGSPIVYQGVGAESGLFAVADVVLSHNRPIITPEDDSVLRFSPFGGQKIIIRRSRGLAPTFIPPAPIHRAGQTECMLAMGASMKSAFAIARNGKYYASQYLGDLEQFDTQRHFEQTLQHFLQIFQERPARILGDLHAGYFSTQLGKTWAAEWGIDFLAFQHHKAHFAAALAENGLLDTHEHILGVIWDGTGLGEDGQIWGGEYFLFSEKDIRRVSSFSPFPVITGDKMAREPRLSALSAGYGFPIIDEMLRGKFSEQEWTLYTKMLQAPILLKTHSVGRLFDAAACLLGMADRTSYEGEAAMYVEAQALEYYKQKGLAGVPGYETPSADEAFIPGNIILAHMADELLSGAEPALAAARFHQSLINTIAAVARRNGCTGIAFSGGVWQNGLLVDLAKVRLEKEFSLYFHQQLSPGDENVSLGQLALHALSG